MPVSYDFSDKTAVVTGASKGIGRRIAERFRDAGAQVWNWDVAPAEFDGVGQSTVDVTDADQIARAVTRFSVSPPGSTSWSTMPGLRAGR